MIAIPRAVIEDMLDHASQQAPLEACGLLVGVGDEVIKSYRLTNVDASAEHFSLDPKEQFAVVKEIRLQGWDVLAVYHSHPASPARMSEEDLRLALAPGMKYVIISLADNEKSRIKGFTVLHGRCAEEEVLTE